MGFKNFSRVLIRFIDSVDETASEVYDSRRIIEVEAVRPD
jgi:hypothetical protein